MTYYNLSLISPDDPRKDPMFRRQWKSPLVSLSQAIQNQVRSMDMSKQRVVGDPTNFEYNPAKGLGLDFDRGWDLDIGDFGFGNQGRIPKQISKGAREESRQKSR